MGAQPIHRRGPSRDGTTERTVVTCSPCLKGLHIRCTRNCSCNICAGPKPARPITKRKASQTRREYQTDWQAKKRADERDVPAIMVGKTDTELLIMLLERLAGEVEAGRLTVKKKEPAKCPTCHQVIAA